MEVLDHLNAKDGRGTLYFAGQGIQTAWQMKREMQQVELRYALAVEISQHYSCFLVAMPVAPDYIETSFALNEPYYGNSASVKLLTPTQDSRDIITAATKCLEDYIETFCRRSDDIPAILGRCKKLY
jgi:hypothetical protein